MRGEVSEGAVAAFAVVEGFQVVEDRGGGDGFGSEGLAVVEEFVFEGGEGAFGEGVVVAIAGGAHALVQAVAGEQLTGEDGGVLTAAIGMEEGVGSDQAGVEGAAQSAGDDLGVERIGELPAEDGAAEEVDDDGEVEPSFAGGDVGDVADEVGAGSLWRSGLSEQIGRADWAKGVRRDPDGWSSGETAFWDVPAGRPRA